ncbi:YdiU family protein [Romeria aff. gracilis LEGE 07310]|uniref:Protein nucleotidyltransferase YdiU n=1 Tax=Vasconcelosia minhoensis LEGE 07310 TaxID=915328 RepID=A0A8J7AHN4_9CYAN|nr:YdiU family protein [Romeria gracilis]MBE9079124.1 YdiU family protein [Romeria aff. gracilis LEGE 07310]
MPANPLLSLPYESALVELGDDYFDPVAAAKFPRCHLRFRNDRLLQQLGLEASQVTDEDFIQAFGRFEGCAPFLALRYHGYQFGEYNPFLGDGRGFLYGQLRNPAGVLYDLGTKGSGTTPYSRGGDGRLTLKGGVREVLAAEALHALGVRTSRCLSLVETGEALWRGDEPSPTRSAVMVRWSHTHIRFGTFERLDYLGRPDLMRQLLDHAISTYYPHLKDQPAAERDAQFFAELVARVASLVAQWMSAGFCHAVLNTDNMSIVGESFDYGPYAFIPEYDPKFTAAYFDYSGRYSYGNQPAVCRWNLQMLAKVLSSIVDRADLEAGLAPFESHYQTAYRQRMLQKLGFELLPLELAELLLQQTIELLSEVRVGYHEFFAGLAQQFSPDWRSHPQTILQATLEHSDPAAVALLKQWRQTYQRGLSQLPADAMAAVGQRLRQHNPSPVLLRPLIEAVWEPITTADDWQPFYDLIERIQPS